MGTHDNYFSIIAPSLPRRKWEGIPLSLFPSRPKQVGHEEARPFLMEQLAEVVAHVSEALNGHGSALQGGRAEDLLGAGPHPVEDPQGRERPLDESEELVLERPAHCQGDGYRHQSLEDPFAQFLEMIEERYLPF